MDVEIIKKDGSSFLLSSHDIYAKDFIVSSIELDPHYSEVENRSGRIDNGATYKARTITVPFYIKAHDLHDFALLRDELFSLAVSRESFYIRELRRAKYQAYEFVDTNESPRNDESTENKYIGGKRYKVRIANVIELDQSLTFGEGDLEFETTELPFAESIGTSADIDNPELIPLIPDLWEQGYINNATGGHVSNSTTVRIADYYEINPDTEYMLKTYGNYEVVLIQYDSSKNPLGSSYTINAGKSFGDVVFTSQNSARYYRIYFRRLNDPHETLNPYMVGTTLKASLKQTTSGINSDDELWGFGMGLIADDDSLIYTHTGTEFKIFNPGVEVDPFEQDLTIEISDVEGSTSYLQLENRTTGDVFRVTEAVNNNQLIKLDGPNITSNNLQYLRKTNRKYITLAPGWNNFRITGATSAKVSFNMRFYYL